MLFGNKVFLSNKLVFERLCDRVQAVSVIIDSHEPEKSCLRMRYAGAELHLNCIVNFKKSLVGWASRPPENTI